MAPSEVVRRLSDLARSLQDRSAQRMSQPVVVYDEGRVLPDPMVRDAAEMDADAKAIIEALEAFKIMHRLKQIARVG